MVERREFPTFADVKQDERDGTNIDDIRITHRIPVPLLFMG